MALQTLVMEELQRRSAKEPLLLVDTLLGDQGQDFVMQIIQQQLGDARRRALTLEHLQRAYLDSFQHPDRTQEVA
jgi:hypothetical protein